MLKALNLHPWNVPVEQAIGIQEELALKVELVNDLGPIRYLAGADIAVNVEKKRGYAAVILYEFPGLKPVEVAWAEGALKFPYVPGLLTFREGPLLLGALGKLAREPDLIIFDGQGIAHPRHLGIASHIGVLLQTPTVGSAKSRLVGTFEEPGKKEGAMTELIYKGRHIGMALRSRAKTAPIFVSPGHKIDYDTSVKLVRACLDGYRVPKPTRQADALADAVKRGEGRAFAKRLK